MKEAQNYKNHVRWYPPFHFVLAPLFAINLIYWAVRLYQEPGWDHAALVLLGISLIILMLVSRLFALKNQDRIVRLEESIRYSQVLPSDLAPRAAALDLQQVIALRFASDDELPSLVERTLNGEFATANDIKLAVKDWRADLHRV
ncbi:MAG: hypothetical protein IPM63_05895 [Acidobacteriota bacterium]|nr:MAG: hypothetical protein IPM63_05895 [Acidobacteriota bacterium]